MRFNLKDYIFYIGGYGWLAQYLFSHLKFLVNQRAASKGSADACYSRLCSEELFLASNEQPEWQGTEWYPIKSHSSFWRENRKQSRPARQDGSQIKADGPRRPRSEPNLSF